MTGIASTGWKINNGDNSKNTRWLCVFDYTVVRQKGTLETQPWIGEGKSGNSEEVEQNVPFSIFVQKEGVIFWKINK